MGGTQYAEVTEMRREPSEVVLTSNEMIVLDFDFRSVRGVLIEVR